MNKVFSDIAWEDYTRWLIEDKKIVKKINDIIKDIERNGYNGIGKPEALRHELAGYWSRRITDKDRLIYKIEDATIYILSCKGHYND
ncbi:Txe/YoeB family addiction module toxin [Mahella australiensis]|uniref:Endoribonuclease YoeB n=1 Tax=Mahella australiensis (strain DSM 15567 / CIP 107919 / 50-1 BON) TaxID=697281 RepID=F3ZWG3_MAHA5|nr:Txe/YoeB family addiction module toxin [Mahella australiensis]AEE95398.1 addiction module toxin, Txe/YoeB family [Mahella australiensis 50-1 BON]